MSREGLQGGERKRLRLGIAKKLSAVASLAASLGGTWAANSDIFTAPRPSIPVLRSANVDANVGGEDVLPGVDTFRLLGIDATLKLPVTREVTTPSSWVEVVTTRREAVSKETRIQGMVWARLFDKDPRAGETANGDLQIINALNDIRALENAGYVIDRVTYGGSASSENTTRGDGDARLNDDDPENVALANKRAGAVLGKANTIRPDLSGRSEIIPGVEAKDTVLNQAIYEIAKKRGVNADELVLSYNKGTAQFSTQELAVLDELAKQRFVMISVEAHKIEVISELKYVDGEWTTETRDEKKGTFVFIPILIPYIRGRMTMLVPGQRPASEPIKMPKMPRNIPPREIGSVRGGHSDIVKRRIQPGQLNDGRNSGSRGQGGPYKPGKNRLRRGRG